jgi:hypothetical protein
MNNTEQEGIDMSKQNGTWTKRFDMFSLDKENRPHDPGKHKRLVESLEHHGYDGARPVVCVRKNGRLFIIDGQHRYHWCREHGVAFTYTVSEFASPREFNGVEVPWSMGDYISSHINAGNKAVTELAEFQQAYGLPPTLCEMLLSGRCGTAHGRTIKDGNVQIKDRDFAHNVARTVKGIGEVFKYAKEMLFVTAVARCCRVVEFVPNRLIEQAKSWPAGLTRAATVEQYSTMIDDLYNRNAKGKRIPLRFLADQAMRLRNRAIPGNK